MSKKVKSFKEVFEKTNPQVLKEGDTIEAKVLSRTNNRLWLDIEGRGIGVVPFKELPADFRKVASGVKVLAYVLKPEDEEGNIVLSLRRADRDKVWSSLRASYEKGEIMDIIIDEANKGGLMAELSGVRGFLPVSQLATEHYPRVSGGDKHKILEKLNRFISKTIQVKIINIDPENAKLIFSEKAVGDLAQKELIKNLKIDQQIVGEISGIVDFGLFVRFYIGSEKKIVEGLIHISEVSWEKISDLRKIYSVGDKMKAKIISIDDGKVSLSIKRLLPDPWISEVKKFKVGKKVKGKVTRVTPFGAFVKISDKIEGLVHISEISDEHVTDPREVLSIGDEKEFKIVTIEPEAHRIGLSLKNEI